MHPYTNNQQSFCFLNFRDVKSIITTFQRYEIYFLILVITQRMAREPLKVEGSDSNERSDDG